MVRNRWICFTAFWVSILLFGIENTSSAQDMLPLVKAVKAKLDKVNDYVADGKIKTDIAFIKAPLGKVQVYFKKPDHFKLKRVSGISMLPKGGIRMNLGSLLMTDDYMAIGAGDAEIDGVKLKIVQLLPTQENSDLILTKLYINEKDLLIQKAITTTKENGTYEMQMFYDKFKNYALPDKVIFSFNTKDYKMPKGITLEFDDAEKQPAKDKVKKRKGKVEITYTNYIINKGVSDTNFN